MVSRACVSASPSSASGQGDGDPPPPLVTLISWEAVRVYPANGSVPIAEKLLHLAGAAAVASMLPEVRRAIDPRRRYGARGRGGACRRPAPVVMLMQPVETASQVPATGQCCRRWIGLQPAGSRFPDRK